MPAAATVIDLRSDTVTRPTREMRSAMAIADVGDDVFNEDPTVHELEELGAEMLGRDAALFVPSGTMANVIGVALRAGRGDEVIAESLSHVVMFEGGGMSWIAGAMLRAIPSVDGALDPQRVREAIRGDNVHFPRSKLLCLENTHNMHGGTVMSVERMTALRETAELGGLAVHLDGARLFNAAIAAGVDVKEYTRLADTVSVCLSKGLGAPVGSLLLGDAPVIAEARRIRKVLGGGMRQAGIIAEGGISALRHGPARLADDHRRARELAAAFRTAIDSADGTAAGFVVPEPATNMVLAKCPPDPALEPKLADALAARGVRAIAIPERGIRFVTHFEITDPMIERAADAFAEALADLD
jgi:threonine aldolase